MANVRISDLPAATAAADSDLLEISKSGTSQRVTRGQLIAGRAAAGPATSAGLTMATARILGRTTSGTGTPEELPSVPVSLGGTGATDAATARTNLGLEGMATQQPASVAITGGSIAGAAITNASLVTDTKGELRDAPLRSQTAAYTAVLDDAGRMISIAAGGVTIPAGVFSAGKRFTIFNNSPLVQTISPASGVTLYLAGTQRLGAQSIGPRGFVDVECVAANAFVLSGAGLLMPAPDGITLVAPNFLAAPLTLTRAQTAGVEVSAVNGAGAGITLYGADVPRFSGLSQRLLTEGPGVNAFSNPRLEGAIAGNPGTPPTNTNTSFGSGLSREIVGSGIEDNIPYVDLRFFGTATSGSFSRFALINITTQGLNISGNAVSTFSVFVRLVGGSLSQISDVRIGVQGRNSAGSVVANQSALASFTPTGASLGSQERMVTWTPTDANVFYGEWFLDIMRGGTATVDVTLRIGAPQHELGHLATSRVFPPVGAQGNSTRGNEFILASLESLGIRANAGCTVLWSGVVPKIQPAGQMQIWQIDDGGNINRMFLRVVQNATQLNFFVLGGAQTVLGNFTPGTPLKVGCSYNPATGRMAASLNGAAPVATTGGTLVSATTFRLGRQPGSAADGFIETEHLRIIPYPFLDAEIQQLTGASP